MTKTNMSNVKCTPEKARLKSRSVGRAGGKLVAIGEVFLQLEIFLMMIIAKRNIIMKKVFKKVNIPEQYLPLLQSPEHKRNIYGRDLRQKTYLQNQKQM